MDGYSGKRHGERVKAPRKGRDQNAQYCNRIGCSGRINHNDQNKKIGSSDKAKCPRSSFCSSNGNEVIGNSSRSNSVMTRAKTPYLDSKRKLRSQLEFDSSASSSSGDLETRELVSSPSRSSMGHHLGSTSNQSGDITMAEVGTTSVPSNVSSQKTFQHKSASNSQKILPGSSVPSTSKNSGTGTLNSSNRSRYGVRNLQCNSVSDVQPPNCSSESRSNGKYVMRKRVSEAEGSSLYHRGRRSTAAVSTDEHVFASTSGISILNSRRSNFTSRDDSSVTASVRTRTSVNVNDSRMRLSCRRNGRNSSTLRESTLSVSPSRDSDMPMNVGGPSSSQQFSRSGSSSGFSSYSLSSSNVDSQSTEAPFTSAEVSFTHLADHDAFQLYNMDGIAEVLLALERIEQDGELTHEQVLALETSLFLSGLNLHDQHRDMRLDIDNMSYEELLALEERMGTVSTALSEEALLKCVSRSIYQANPPDVGATGLGDDGDDIKCSICQEEYALGDEIGKLVECQHVYHTTCINLWLQLKNWCPICKAAAAPQQSSSS